MIFVVQEHENKEKNELRVRSSDQIHPDTKREQLPSGAVPAYSLSGGFPSCSICSHILLCAAFLLFWHHFWDQETRNRLMFGTKKQNEQMYSCKSQEGVEVESLCFPLCRVPSGRCHFGSAAPSSCYRAKAGGAVGTGSAMEKQPRAQQCRSVAAKSVAETLLAASDLRLLPGHGVAQGQHRNRLCRQGWLSAAAAGVGLWRHGFLGFVTLLSIRSLSGK